MPARLILVGGGGRSGKSGFALAYAKRLTGQSPALFIATAQAFDDEMRARIDRHRLERDASFETVEEPRELPTVLAAAASERVVLVDCLTLWLSNLLLDDVSEVGILEQIEALVLAATGRAGPTLLVTNEVGMGLVPETPLGRRFRDLTGLAHQRLASAADEVYAAMMGLVVRLHPAPLASFSKGHTP